MERMFQQFIKIQKLIANFIYSIFTPRTPQMNSQSSNHRQLQDLDFLIGFGTKPSQFIPNQDPIFHPPFSLPKKPSIIIQDSLFDQVNDISPIYFKNTENQLSPSKASSLSTSGQSDSSSNSLFRKCTCTKSRCLKNYCECFKLGIKCNEECECRQCKNHVQLFLLPTSVTVEKIKCKCKKSRCLKNYCECHSAGKKCSPACQCAECENGSEALEQGETRKRVKSDPFLQFESYFN